MLEGAGHYTPELAESKRSTGAQLEHRKRLFAAAAPGVRRFFRAGSEGYLLLKVYADRVDARVLQRNERGSGQSDPGALK